MILLRNIKGELKKNKWIYKFYTLLKQRYCGVRNIILNKYAIRVLEKQKKIHYKAPVKIVFILQDLNVWDKTKPIFEEIREDTNFSIMLLCVPSWYGDDKVRRTSLKNDTFDLINACSYQGVKVIDSYIDGKSWYNVKSFNPSYVFYTRPYDEYLPQLYRSYVVSSYSCVCYTSYIGGLTLSHDFFCLSSDFRRFCGLFFATSNEEADNQKREFSEIFNRNLAITVVVGCPAFANFFQKKDIVTEVWSFSKNNFRVVWTPRWTLDPGVGGTNFLRYKKQFVELIKSRTDIDFVVRPHQLMFGNLINIGAIKEEEVCSFQSFLNNATNALLDENKNYEGTLWGSDVLVTDYSSLISLYFLTGKPIIYCPSEKSTLTETKVFNRILEVNYTANSFEEIVEIINLLKGGKDQKRNERIKAQEEIIGKDYIDSVKKVKEELLKDFRERCIFD